MSRIGRQPIPIPKGVTVTVAEGNQVTVKGPNGELQDRFNPELTIAVEGGQVLVGRPTDQRQHRSLHGLTRSLLANMVTGVTEGFSKRLEIQGVGYRAEASGKKLKLTVGFSHPVEMAIPDGVKVSVESNTLIRIEGIDKALVGQFAADVRGFRPPEPYKGKGIRYQGEHVRRKVGKAGAA